MRNRLDFLRKALAPSGKIYVLKAENMFEYVFLKFFEINFREYY